MAEIPDRHGDDQQAQKDEAAFQELQRYADFQRVLFDRIRKENVEDQQAAIDPRQLEQDNYGYFLLHSYVHTSPQSTHNHKLPFPFIIPQYCSGDTGQPWKRVYPPILEDYGIDQYAFLDFIDSLNGATIVSIPTSQLFNRPN